MLLRKSFRTLAGFGKRIEYWIIGRMLKEGLNVIPSFGGRRRGRCPHSPTERHHRLGANQGAITGCAFRRRGTFRWHYSFQKTYRLLVRVLFRTNGRDVDHHLKRVYQRKLPKHEGQECREPHHLVQRNAPRQRVYKTSV